MAVTNSSEESESRSSDYLTDTSDSESPLQQTNNKTEPSVNAESGSSGYESDPEQESPITGVVITIQNKPEPESKKKWVDVEETDILTSMIDYEKKTNVSPKADMFAFLDYVKSSFSVVDVTKEQLRKKIWRIKNKYQSSKGRPGENENAFFELAEKLWGNEGNIPLRKQPSRKRKTPEIGNDRAGLFGLSDEENGDGNVEKKKAVIGNRVGMFGLSNEEKLLSIGAELFGGDEGIEGSDKWRKLEREEMELCAKQLDVKRAKMRLVLDTLDD